MIKYLQNKLRAFIPQHIKNRTVLILYDLLRRCGSNISEKRIQQNAVANTAELGSRRAYYFPEKTRYIENQFQWEKIRFGNGKKSAMSHSGCGIIAAYNALAALRGQGSPEVMVELVSSFERDGAALGGRFGVAPGAIYEYFASKGFSTVMTGEKNPEVVDRIGETHDVVIVTAYNDEMDITAMLHTVCMTRDGEGAYVIHNGNHKDSVSGRWDENRTGKYSLTEAVSQIGKKSVAVSVIGVKRNSS